MFQTDTQYCGVYGASPVVCAVRVKSRHKVVFGVHKKIFLIKNSKQIFSGKIQSIFNAHTEFDFRSTITVSEEYLISNWTSYGEKYI